MNQTLAILYIRFSTLEQRGGNSIQRQRQDCSDLCQRKGWQIEAELIDEGKSAFTGKNREETSCFGQFEAEAKAGLHKGKVLVVERLDRLSRAEPDKGYDLLRSLTAAGVSVATVDGDEFYEAGKPLNFAQIILLFTKYYVANEESVKKAQRVRDGKAAAVKRARLEGRTITKTTPPWIMATKTTREVIEPAADIVRLVFRLCDEEGLGRTKIVQRLHAMNIPPIGRRGSDGWHESFISKLLRNRAVLGEFTPRHGEPIEGYYPAIVSAAVFERVNAQASARKEQMGGRKDERLSNLLSGLLVCAECGGPMRYRQTYREGSKRIVNGRTYIRKRPDAYLVCSRSERGSTCDKRTRLPYVSIERGLLDALLHLAMDDQAFSNRGEIGRVSELIAQRKRAHEIAEERAKKFWAAWAEDSSAMAKELARSAEQEAADIKTNLIALEDQLASARGRASDAEHLQRVADIKGKLYDPDLELRVPLRRKVSIALAGLIDRIECHGGGVSVFLKAGAGLLCFDRLGKLKTAFDLVHPKRPTQPQLKEYLRRRADAMAGGELFREESGYGYLHDVNSSAYRTG